MTVGGGAGPLDQEFVLQLVQQLEAIVRLFGSDARRKRQVLDGGEVLRRRDDTSLPD
jgi:hypothetical protein